jgi:hypothetical protein
MAAGIIKLTVQASRFDSAQTDFPVIFNATTSSGTNAFSWVNFFNEMSDADRKKVKIYLSDHVTELKAEIEPGYDFASSKVVYHVKADDIDDGDIFYLDYDSTFAENTTYIGDTASAPSVTVWGNDVTCVHHMVDNTTSEVLDSAKNFYDGTKKGANEPIQIVSSIGYGQDFDIVDDFISIGTLGNLGSALDSQEYTIFEGVVKSAVTDTIMDVMGTANTGSNTTLLIELNKDKDSALSAGRIRVYQRDEDTASCNGAVQTDTGITDGNEHYLVVNIDGSNNLIKVYLDGVLQTFTYFAQNTPDNMANFEFPMYLGAFNNRGTAASLFDGVISEFRISLARSADWILATNYSLKDDMFAMEDFVELIVATPVIDPLAGEKLKTQLISMTCATDEADIHYTLNGDTPDLGDPIFTTAFTLDSAKTIKAIGIKAAFTDSDVVSETYTISQAEQPVFNPIGGTYSIGVTIKITSSTLGSSILYSIDGSTPTIQYTGPINNFNGTLKAIAQATGYLDSEITSDDYVLSEAQEWNEFRNLGPDSFNFTEQPDKWGYLNNPRWVPESDATQKHIPCGHWHKNPRPGTVISNEITPIGRWVAALSERDRSYIYVYDVALYSIIKIDVLSTPKVVDMLVVNNADYILDYSQGYGSVTNGARGAYCISRSYKKLWYLFRNNSNGDLRLVEIDISSQVMSIINTSLHSAILPGEHFHDAVGNDDYAFFPTNKISGRILRFDADHTLLDKEFNYTPTGDGDESIATISLNPLLNEIAWAYVRIVPFATAKYPYSDFDFNIRKTVSLTEGGSDSAKWQNFFRYDELYDYLFVQRAFNPLNGVARAVSDWEIYQATPSMFIQDLEYMQNLLGGNSSYYYILHMNTSANFWRLRRLERLYTPDHPNEVIPSMAISATPYVNRFGSKSVVSTYNDKSNKSYLISFDSGNNTNYIASFDEDLDIVRDTPISFGISLETAPSFPEQNTDNEPQVWALPGQTYDKKNNID